MLIPEEIRKCVVFLGNRSQDGMWIYRGTAFFLTRPLNILPPGAISYLVTSKHVIDNIRDSGSASVGVRVNFKNGARWLETPVQNWLFHPTDDEVDIAMLPMAVMADSDQMTLLIDIVATGEIVKTLRIGPGDDVFFAGLFSMHEGQARNIPIMRVGNIAAMPEERIVTNFGFIDAYLVEARSTGGLSGCPVFVHLAPVGLQRRIVCDEEGSFFLLGVMQGHWDEMSPRNARGDTVIEDSLQERGVNMGIAIVVPATKILEILNHPQMLERDRKIEEEVKRIVDKRRTAAD